ncbi:MAG: TIGR00341 family protein [Gammaproteobacteria bacterium]|nr:TIGR00341 family protein [Gammaproteobacteria bacterium]
MILKNKESKKVSDLLKDYKIIENRQIKLTDSEVLVRVLLDAEKSEEVLDILNKAKIGREGNRMVILSVEATLPRAVTEPTVTPKDGSTDKNVAERISREELYESIKNSARCTKSYMMMVLLSTIVAIVGLYNNSATITIGAMLIAPFLGPNIALAVGATLGDLSLMWHALRTGIVGIIIAMLLSIALGFLVRIDPTLLQVASRTSVGLGDIVLALTAGCAGALAFVAGNIPATMVGVMVAVALLPSLVAFGLLLGGGELVLAMNALILFLVNLVCVNLSSIITFLAQGVHPIKWREKNLAVKASYIAIGLCLLFLVGLIGTIILSKTI